MEIIVTPEDGRLTDDQLDALIRYEDNALTAELETMDSFRSYYEGNQAIVYATDEFNRAFGDEFPDFRANWCGVVIDATEERIGIDRIIFREEEEGEVDLDITNRIWKILHDNDLPELENILYGSALVESRGAVIVWPDEEMGARIDAQPAQNIRVSYDTDDYRKISHAIKRWATPSGEMRLTLYTPDFLYKYHISPVESAPDTVAVDDLPAVEEIRAGATKSWAKRPVSETGDPSWPLPNPLGEVPIVEFSASKGMSELSNIIPLQDALNKTMVNMLVASEFAATAQAYVVTSNTEPDGGWKRQPGTVWHLMPEVDIEGRPLPTQVGTIDEASPAGFIALIETFLQQVSQISKTPTYYFFQSSSGGSRGDAPSGDSLRVTETALVKKIEKYHENWGSQWVKIARLIAKADKKMSNDLPPLGEVSWANPQSHFMGLLLEEGRRMIQDLYLPPEFAWRHLGMSEVQIAEAKKNLDKNGPLGMVMTRENMNTNVNIESGEQPSGKAAGIPKSKNEGMKKGTTEATTNR